MADLNETLRQAEGDASLRPFVDEVRTLKAGFDDFFDLLRNAGDLGFEIPQQWLEDFEAAVPGRTIRNEATQQYPMFGTRC